MEQTSFLAKVYIIFLLRIVFINSLTKAPARKRCPVRSGNQGGYGRFLEGKTDDTKGILK